MPRLHLGSERRRAGPGSSRHSSSSTKSSLSSSRGNKNNDVDSNMDFDYDDEDDDFNTTNRGDMNRSKNISGSGSGGGWSQITRKPTHSSPKITISDLAKKKSTATNSKNNAGNNNNNNNKTKKPFKPVNNNNSSKEGKNKVNDDDDDENSENHIQKKMVGRKQQQKKKGKKQQQQQQVSFLDDLSDDDTSMSSGKRTNARKKKGENTKSINNKAKKYTQQQQKKKRSNARYDDSCLMDTDDDESSSASSSEDDDVMIVEKKESGKDNNKNKRGTTTKKHEADDKSGRTYSKSQHAKKKQQGGNNDAHDNIPILPLRILAIDNRVLPTPMGDSMARVSLLDNIPQLVEGGVRKGVLGVGSSRRSSNSTLVASLALGTKCTERSKGKVTRNKKGVEGALVHTSVVPRVSYLFDNDTEDDNAPCIMSKVEKLSWMSDFVPPINSGFGTSNDGFEPKGFSANDAWECFGDLVEAVEYKLSCSTDKLSSNHTARQLTLFTTDANLFAETESSAHVRGLTQFWKRIDSCFQTNVISSVTILVVETMSTMEMMASVKSYDDSTIEGSIDKDTSSLGMSGRLSVMQCVADIRQRINDLNRAQESNVPINLQVDFMEGNSIGFQSLLQAWSKETFFQTYANHGDVQGRLSFDLPETYDGTMCQLSLDLQYTLLPFSVDSNAAKGLVEDMRCISTSSVEVVQTIPLASVDSSMIHGIPMSARAARMNDDFSEMKVLARQLWRYLGRNDLALVLRARADTSTKEGGGLFSSGDEQLFLLTCEEVVQKPPQDASDVSKALHIMPDKNCQGESPCHGMLFRYATQTQMLREYLICLSCFLYFR